MAQAITEFTIMTVTNTLVLQQPPALHTLTQMFKAAKLTPTQLDVLMLTTTPRAHM